MTCCRQTTCRILLAPIKTAGSSRRVTQPNTRSVARPWLFAHADERHRPEVRAMIDRLRAVFDERAGLLSGMLVAAV